MDTVGYIWLVTVHWPRPLLQVLNKVLVIVDGSISTRYILLVRDMTASIHEATTHDLSFLQVYIKLPFNKLDFANILGT